MNNRFSRQKKRVGFVLTAVLCLSMFGNNAFAQDDGGWDFRITPYLWMISLDGETAVAGQNVPVEADFSDILDNLNGALAANFEANNGQYFFILDAMYAQLELNVDTNPVIAATVEIDLVIFDGLVGVSISDTFDLYTGVRYYDQDIDVIPAMLPTVSLGDSWTDSVIGVRAQGPVSDKWFFTGRVDTKLAGDSQSMWLMDFFFSRYFGRNNQMHLDLGARIYDVEYESGVGATRFLWDVEQAGPVVAYSWNF